jgi:mRNA-degrading endonuclease RelE of RelBE toxin-antitoxin system
MSSNRFDVQLTREAEKDLRRQQTHTGRVTRAILKLEDDPFLGHPLTGSLKGTRALEFSLPGSGVHRAVYVVSDATRVCLVLIVGPHENIYDRAERRVKALRRAGHIP